MLKAHALLQATEKHDEEMAERNRELTGLQALNAALNRDLKAAEEECRQQEADAAALREQLAGSMETHVCTTILPWNFQLARSFALTMPSSLHCTRPACTQKGMRFARRTVAEAACAAGNGAAWLKIP